MHRLYLEPQSKSCIDPEDDLSKASLDAKDLNRVSDETSLLYHKAPPLVQPENEEKIPISNEEKRMDEAVQKLKSIVRDYMGYLYEETGLDPYTDHLIGKKDRYKKLINIREKNPLIDKKFIQSMELLNILNGLDTSSGKLESFGNKIKEFKHEKRGLVEHRNPGCDKAENIIRGFLALLATATVILAPIVVYKAYNHTLYKRSEGEQMLDSSEAIVNKFNFSKK